jgi:hypothetical protein
MGQRATVFSTPWWRRGPVLVWLWLLLLFLLLWGQHRLAVLHPSYVVFFLLVAAFLATALVTLLRRLWRLVRGPDRQSAFAAALLTLLAVGLFALPPLYVHLCWQDRYVPSNLAGILGRMLGASFMEGAADYQFRNRLESERLVMFYDELDRPEEDLRRMEEHLAEMEKLLGRRLRAKIHWIRGRILGFGNMAFYGLAFGSSKSPAHEVTSEAFLDRHELAHAIINQFRSPDSDPPTVLSEGWAEVQGGYGSANLAQRAVTARRGGYGGHPVHRVRDLVGPDWYHQDSGAVYPVGGGFVDFLLRKYGPEQFLDLYVRCRPGRFERDCEVILGASLEELEEEFWQEAERLVASEPAAQGP